MPAAEIARQVAFALLHHLLAQQADPYDVIARAVRAGWPPLKDTFDRVNPVGAYLGAGLIVNRKVVQAGLCLSPLAATPPYRYAPVVEAAGAAVRLLLAQGLDGDAIAQSLGWDAQELADRLGRLPTDAEWRTRFPRGRKPPRPSTPTGE